MAGREGRLEGIYLLIVEVIRKRAGMCLSYTTVGEIFK